ncbi:MAG TPA: hypothetical protein VMM83_06740 [Longimicrobiales bacterium]|nr:hypothetical protein [Longimicrobiales bacterium]
MGVTPEEVRRLAVMARLGLEAAEATALARQLTGILEHVDRLEVPSGEDVAAPVADAPASAPLRADLPGADKLDRGPADFAPEWRDGFFTVPRLTSHDTGPEEAP